MRTKSLTTELKCGEKLRLSGFMLAHAMLNAIDQVNSRDDILQNITLVADIYDTCRSQTIASGHTKEFIKMTLQPDPENQLAGIIGASVSDVSAKVASILQVFEIPQISYKSTSVLLSDRDIYSYFMRTVPPDSFQAASMVDICLKFNWTYVLTINSAGIYGEKGIEAFHKFAKENNIYTDHIDSITRIANEEEYEIIVRNLVERTDGTSISTVVLFCSLQHSQGITKAAQRNPKASAFVWILSDSFDTTTLELRDMCIMTIQMAEEGLSGSFKKHLDELNMQDPKWEQHVHVVKFWEDWFKCRVKNTSSQNYPVCTGKESLSNVTRGFTLQPIMSAVYAFAHGLHRLQQELCGNKSGLCSEMRHFKRDRLLQHLRNVSFENFFNTSLEFNENGEVMAMYHILNFQKNGGSYTYNVIGEWDGQKTRERLEMDTDDVTWFEAGNGSVPQSYCSAECEFGYVRKEREGYPFNYCWNCHKCGKLQLIVNNTCVSGLPGYIPNARRDAWIKREVLYLKWTNTVPILIGVVSAIAIILTVAVLLIFLTHHKNRTVKASGRELSCIILTGILFCFATPFIFIVKPTDLICIVRSIAPGFALSIIYSALFMKINRVYRVFTSAKITKRRPPLVRPKSQVFITIGLISIELLITLLGMLTHLPQASEYYFADKEKIILECRMESTIYVGGLSYVIVLMILSTVYAFKTRKFPRNFNESKYIGFTLYTTLVTFAIFFAFYLNLSDSIQESALSAIGMLVIGLVSLSGLFGQRLFVIFCVKSERPDDIFMTRNQSSGEISRSPVVAEKSFKGTMVLQETIPGTIPDTECTKTGKSNSM
ncbi:metabotropic glutamate receptor 3-like [Dendronephthya gigantea]|uniref:metabotropic glutamate receptor 3-like n=1 Tax=Dendronephthya gigantea TaxID=151771 RepID=UPI00106A8E2E|nr:metabotropic glutamate receptor 3-like [Dendronephthya gigantea]